VLRLPVKPQIRIIGAGGWKREENKRFGSVVVGIFETYYLECNVKIFQFAPTLDDLPVLEELINAVREVDNHNKAVFALKTKLEALDPVKTGGCYNE